MCRSRGGQGVPDPPPQPLKNHKNIGFSSNTGPDPLKKAKLPSQHSMLGHHWQASEMPFNGVTLAGDDGRLLIVVFVWILSPL